MQRAKRREVIGLLLLTLGLAGLLIAYARSRDRTAKPQAPYVFPVQELAALDKVVQARFAVVPIDDFGMSRIGKRHAVFRSSTPQEKSVIAALDKKKWDVVFYVAGRSYLKNEPSNLGPQFMQGPVFIAGRYDASPLQNPYSYYALQPGTGELGQPPDELPGGNPVASPLKKPAMQALESFKTRGGTEFAAGDWNVVARPVLASSQACVDCHNSRLRPRKLWGNDWYRLDEPMGVAMYAYRPYKIMRRPTEITARQKQRLKAADVIFRGTVCDIKPLPPNKIGHDGNARLIVFQVGRWWKNQGEDKASKTITVRADDGTLVDTLRRSLAANQSDNRKFLIYASCDDQEALRTESQNVFPWDETSTEVMILGKGWTPHW
jgi:hypothetical protein